MTEDSGEGKHRDVNNYCLNGTEETGPDYGGLKSEGKAKRSDDGH